MGRLMAVRTSPNDELKDSLASASSTREGTVSAQNLSFLNVNCRNTVNKSVLLEAWFFTHEPDIAVLPETWLSNNVSDSEIVPKNYMCFHKNRERRREGFAIIIKAPLHHVRMPEISAVDSIFCTIYVNKMRYVIGAIYRPPDSTVSTLENLDD